jgi:MFS family permease
VVLAGFCAFLALYAPQPLLPLLAAAFGKTAASISFTVTVSTIAVALAAPLAGAAADRLGRRNLIVWAAFLVAVPTLLAATSRTFGQLLFWRGLQGLFTPGIFAVTVAYINEEWDEGGGAAMAAYVSGTVLGGFCGRTMSALVAAHWSWRWSFVWLGALNAAEAVAIWVWLPAGRRLARPGSTVSALRAIARHLRNPKLVATYAVGFCVLFTLLTTFTYVNFYLASPPFRLSTAALGWVFVVYLVGGRSDAFRRPVHRPPGAALRIDGGVCGWGGGHQPDLGPEPAGGHGGAGAVLHRGVRGPIGRFQLSGRGGRRHACVGRGTLRHVLLCGRQCGGEPGWTVLDLGRLAGLRGADCLRPGAHHRVGAAVLASGPAHGALELAPFGVQAATPPDHHHQRAQQKSRDGIGEPHHPGSSCGPTVNNLTIHLAGPRKSAKNRETLCFQRGGRSKSRSATSDTGCATA